MLLSTKIGIVLVGHMLIVFLSVAGETITVTLNGQPTGTIFVCLALMWVWSNIARLLLPATREDF